ncbi:hypothetical protein QYM36_001268 [Artemia franciscana]|uniref:Reverse transcriptase n=1 Tax=Artemia franciscana TaxID=6661 RepID=A0AA88I8V6_ARTSF|nr:hypothetical protein QYM36_001268 [Artemia franciscana]
MINVVADRALLNGLQISLPKTKAIQTAAMDETPMTLKGAQIEDVRSLKYLGLTVNRAGKSLEEIRSRISSASKVFIQLRKALWNQTTESSLMKFRHR